MSTRVTNAMKTLLRQLGIDPSASTLPNLGSESDTAAATGSAFAQINDAQNKIGASTDTASATGSLYARTKFNKAAADALDLRADAIEAALLDVQTITLDTVVPTDAVSVGGTTLTFVAAAPGANEVLVGEDDEASAENLAAAITALPGVSATSDGAVVTVTADTVGRGVIIASADTTMTVASTVSSSVMGTLHSLLSYLSDLDARVTALEGE